MKNQIVTLFIFLLAGGILFAQRTADRQDVISYQGMITASDGAPFSDGEYPITVTLYADEGGTMQVWQDTYTVAVRGGVFSIYLGSGRIPLPAPGQMDKALWIGTRIAGGNELRPLTRLGASPYAINVQDEAITTNKLADGAVTADKVNLDYISGVSVNGRKITIDGHVLNIRAGKDIDIDYDEATQSLIIGSPADDMQNGGAKDGKTDDRVLQGTPVDAWTLNGDGVDVLSGAVVNPTSADWIGTNGVGGMADFNIHVNGDPIMRYQQMVAGTTTNVVGGYNGNSVGPNAVGNVIAGGGAVGIENLITGDNYNTIGGGAANQVSGEFSVIAGGSGHLAPAHHGAIGGGESNVVNQNYSTVAGGNNNVASGQSSTVAGGHGNIIASSFSAIGGGETNTIYELFGTIAGGSTNFINVNGGYGTISGGVRNRVEGYYSVVGGGAANNIWSDADVIAGGVNNHISGTYGAISGGTRNYIVGSFSAVGGGISNQLYGSNAVIGGGDHNMITSNGTAAAIPGGEGLVAQSYGQTVTGVRNIPKGNLTPGDPPTDEPIFIIGNGIQGTNSNAFEVSYTGHSTVFHNTGGATPVVLGGTYVDNIVYAWGTVDQSGGILCDFGVSQVQHVGQGWYQITMDLVDPDGNPIQINCGSVTVTFNNLQLPGAGWNNICAFAQTSLIQGNVFDIYLSDHGCNPMDGAFSFKVTGTP